MGSDGKGENLLESSAFLRLSFVRSWEWPLGSDGRLVGYIIVVGFVWIISKRMTSSSGCLGFGRSCVCLSPIGKGARQSAKAGERRCCHFSVRNTKSS